MMTPKVVTSVDTVMTAADRKSLPNSSDQANSFDLLMNKNIQKNKETINAGKAISGNGNKTDIREKQDISAGRQDNSLQKKITTSNLKTATDISNDKSVEVEDVTIPDEIVSVLSQLEQVILTNVAEQLGISEEDLSGQLEAMDMTAFDLLDTNNLKEFVLNFNGADSPVAFLMNEDLEKQLNDLSSLLDELPEEELGLSQQEISDLLSKAEQFLQMQETPVATAEEFIGVQMDKQVLDQDMPNEEGTITNSELPETIPVTVVEEKSSTEKNNFQSEEFSKDSQSGQKERNVLPEKNATPLDTFVQNLSVHQTKNLENVEQVLEQTQIMKDIVNQVVEQIKIAIKPESTSMELQLNPEHLGKISLTVVEKNGQMTASFIAQNHAAKEAIESQIQTLRENLNNQGLKVEAVEVTVSEFGFKQDTQTGKGADSQENGKNKSRSGRRKIDLNMLDEGEVTEEEILAAKVLKDSGGSIDYTA